MADLDVDFELREGEYEDGKMYDAVVVVGEKFARLEKVEVRVNNWNNLRILVRQIIRRLLTDGRS